MGSVSKLLGLEKWPLNREYSFVIPNNICKDLMNITMEKHPREFFFYIISKVEKTSIGNILIAKQLTCPPRTGSGITTELSLSPTGDLFADLRKLVDSLEQDEFVILSHSHYEKRNVHTNIRSQAEHPLGRFLLKSQDLNTLHISIKKSKVSFDKVFFGIFVMPRKNEAQYYLRNFRDIEEKALILKSSDKKEFSILDVDTSKDRLINRKSKGAD